MTPTQRKVVALCSYGGLFVSLSWLILKPDFEPALAAIVSLGGIAASHWPKTAPGYARDVEKRIARFVCNSRQAMNAEEVYVAGTFNDWLSAREGTIEPHELFRLDKVTKEGVVVWEKDILVPIGPHDFKFVVGHNFWIPWYEQSNYPKGSDALGGNNFHMDVA